MEGARTLSRVSNASIGPTGKVTGGTIVESLRAGDSFERRAGVWRGFRSATVVTDTPCELFSLCSFARGFGRWLACPSSRIAWFSRVPSSRL